MRRPACSIAATCCLVVATLVLDSAWAQPIPLVFDALSVEEGLSQVTVTSVAQDAEGFVWIGTDDGANRFDGYTFEVFRHAAGDSASLPHSSVEDLHVDGEGTLWLATFGGGLARFDPSTQGFRSYLPDVAPDAQRIVAIHEAADGTFWLGTNGGLLRFDPATEGFRWMLSDTYPSVAKVTSSPDGMLWLGTQRGLVRLDPATGTTRRFRVTADSSVSAVHVAADGAVWAGTADGLARLDPAAETVTTFGGWTGRVMDLLPDGSGRLWLAVAGSGLVRFDPATGEAQPVARQPDAPSGFPTVRARTLFADASGLLWVGTYNAGVAKQRDTPFTPLVHRPAAPADRVPPPAVGALADDAEGRVWLGSFGSGVARYDPATGRFERFTAVTSGLPTDAARAVAMGSDGRVWIGSTAGAGRLDPETRRYVPVPRALPGGGSAPLGRVIDFHRAHDGSLWVASYETGPCRLDPAADRFRCLLDERPGLELSNRNTYAVYLDRAGRLWASPWGGGVDVIDLATGASTTFRHADADPAALSHDSVVGVTETSDGAFWVSTYGGGLNRFDPATATFDALTTADGLRSNVVYGVLEAGDGALWMSTNRGLVRFRPPAADAPLADGAVEVFSSLDGLPGDEFNGHALARLRSGALAFGGPRGLTLFDPAAVQRRTYAPPVVLTDVRVMEQSVPFYDAARGGPQLRLGHRRNFLAFEFAALDFDAPQAARYAYRLDGLDAGWVEAGTRRYAAYAGLRPGRYVLRVSGTNSDGVWSPHEARFAFEIVPPFWQTWWFRLGAGLLALGALVGGVRHLAQRRLRERMRALEAARRVQAERERISRDLHDHVGAQLATMISGIELVHLATDAGQPDAARDHLGTLDGDARRTMTQLRETIWALDQQAVPAAAFAERVQQMLDQQTRYRDGVAAACDASDAEGTVLSPAQALHLFRIAQEAVTNALKHADPRTLRVDLRRDGDCLALCVTNDGSEAGTTAPNVGGDGAPSGYGLRNMRRRAEDLGGDFRFAAEAGQAEVQVRVPVYAAEAAG
ncbi:MAG: two-component regulator propeller domain-containing protein [Bacteroidota bacterium]